MGDEAPSLGAEFERCRREDRGAEGAEGVSCPLLTGEGSEERTVPPPQKKI